MSVESGQTLAHHRLVEKIGEGGMGVVWKAVDTRLGREVAIKILPDTLAEDPERVARFEREAKLLASLNHPNIAAIHGIEQEGDHRFLVLELAPGETLAERLLRGPLSVEETLTVCRQIAEALEAAHRQGVIHRDLKPDNVKITLDDQVKVLDFGIAKALEPPGAAGGTDPELSATVTTAGTRPGTVMGTAAYMSPEQARGKPVDRRTDIWAFGCLVYECLTARQAFAGETIADILASVLHGEPDLDGLPPDTPAPVRRLIRRCLRKDARARLHDPADARIVIEEALAGEGDVEEPATAGVSRRPAGSARLAWLVAALFAAVALGGTGWTLLRRPESPRPDGRFSVLLPDGQVLAGPYSRPVAVSPAGDRLVYAGGGGEAVRLFVRAWDSLEAETIAGTEGGRNPFFSPDGRSIGFFAEGKLKRVSLEGGAPVALCESDVLGASWGPDGHIYYSPSWNRGVFRVPAAGGKCDEILPVDPGGKAQAYLWPSVLPSGDAVIVSVWLGTGYQVAALSTSTGNKRVLIEGGADARYAPTGHLVYARAGSLFAVPFDPDDLEVRGDPVLMLDGVRTSGASGAAHYDFSPAGALVYAPGGVELESLRPVWVDRRGVIEPLTEEARPFLHPRLSPDGKRLAVSIAGMRFQVWVYDIEQGRGHRFTFGGESGGPVWTPDGNRLCFWKNEEGTYDLFWKASDGSGAADRLLRSGRFPIPTDWSPDGTALLYHEAEPNPTTGADVRVLRVKDQEDRALVQTEFNEWGGRFSPDGNWVVYSSDESGRAEVYLQAYPEGGSKRQVSTNGGSNPVWSPEGDELFYVNGRQIWSVPVVASHRHLSLGEPTVLFEGPFLTEEGYDVHPDGSRFVMLEELDGQAPATHLHLHLDWFETLRRRAGSP